MRIFLIIIFLLPHLLFSQSPISVNITEKDGLPDIEFYNILEDKKGFVWLCADKGLFKYDGKNYISISNSDKRGLSVFEPFEDNRGRIWVNNISGQFFYVENNKLITFIDFKNELNGVLASFIVTDNYLIVNASTKVYRVDLKTKAVDLILKSEYLISKIHKTNNGYFALSKDSFYFFSSDFEIPKKNFLKYSIKVDGWYESVPSIFKFKERYFVSYLINQKTYFFSLDTESLTLTIAKGLEFLSNKRLTVIKVLQNYLWIGSNEGAYKINFIDNTFYKEEHIISSEYVSGFLLDKDFNYWLLTLSNGIYILPNIALKSYDLPDRLSRISCEAKVNDSLTYLGTKNGYFIKLNIKNGNYKAQRITNSQISAIYYNQEKKRGILASDLSSFFITNDKLKIDEQRQFSSSKSFSEFDVSKVAYCNYKDVGIHDFEANETENISIGKRAYSTFYDTLTSSLYVGFLDNLIVYKNGKQKPVKYKDKVIFATSLTQTSDGTIWASTFKNGIYAINKNQNVTNYSKDNGLKSNQIEYIKAENNDLWIATDNGLQFFDVKANKFKSLQKTDGIPSYKITGINFYDNKVLCTSNKGVFKFNKDKIFKQIDTPKIYFNKIKIGNQSQKIEDSYDLSYDQNAIEIGFNINGYSYNESYQYEYRLVGYSDSWVITNDNEYFIKYNSLSSGKYTFEIRPAGLLKAPIKKINIKIRLPFWKTWWFITLCSLILFGLVVLIFKYLINKKEKQRAAQVEQLSIDNELISLKLENLRSQMNPHFIFNALNSIQEYIILNQRHLASDYLSKFAQLIRMYLEHSAKGSITLDEEIQCLKMYLELEQMRFEDKLDFKITTDDTLNNFEDRIPTMLIQPYVENAIKHGLLHRDDDRKLTINFSKSQNSVQCIITDNGMGRGFSENYKSRNYKKHKSFATQANYDRLKLLNYSKEKHIGVKIEDLYDYNKPTGTKVIINIPFNK